MRAGRWLGGARGRRAQGSLQSRKAPQVVQTILHWRSSIRAPQRSQVCTHSVTPGRAGLGDGRGRWSIRLVHYLA